MSDDRENPETEALATVNPEQTKKPVRRVYSDEEIYTALAAYDLNGHNVHRTSIALGIPYSTLSDWVKERAERQKRNAGSIAEGRREKRGDLAAKLEDKLHSVIESVDDVVIKKATLSQRGVFIGIAADKIRLLRAEGLDPDPAMELCRILGINRSQLPDQLVLAPGEELPPEFTGQYIDLQPGPDGVLAPVSSHYRHPAFPPETLFRLSEDQADLAPGYLRLFAVNSSHPDESYIFPSRDLIPAEPPEPTPEDDTQLLNTIPDDQNEN